MRLLKWLILAIILLLLVSGVEAGKGKGQGEALTTIRVRAGDSINTAIGDASDGYTIKLSKGTYYENVVIDKSISIEGTGHTTTTINGDADQNPNTMAGTVISISNPDADVALTGLTITGGSNDVGVGGGIYNTGTLTLSDVAISGNKAFHGGGILNTGTLTLNSGTSISGNTANINGGGIYNNGGTIIMNSGSSVSDNIAMIGSGGGIYDYAGTITMNAGSSVANNFAYGGAGGVYIGAGTLTMFAGSSITSNTANRLGGGIVNEGTVIMHGGSRLMDPGSSIAGNEANLVGGGMYNLGSVTMYGGSITGNYAFNEGGYFPGNGGGIYNGPSGTFTQLGGSVTDNNPDNIYP